MATLAYAWWVATTTGTHRLLQSVPGYRQGAYEPVAGDAERGYWACSA